MNIKTAALLLAMPMIAWTAPVTPEGTLKVEGDSTLHKWSTTATKLEADFVLADEKAGLADAVAAGKVKSMTLSVPVAGLSSGEKGLDKNMRKAMKEPEFPAVTYSLTSYELAKDGLSAATTGQLTIAGVTKPIAMTLSLKPAAGATSVSGAYALKMSDFGIEPPKLMMGAIKVKDPVTVRFDLILKTTHKEN